MRAAAGGAHRPGPLGSGPRRRFRLHPVVLLERALHAVDDGLRHLAEKRVALAVPVLEARLRDVLECFGHGVLQTPLIVASRTCSPADERSRSTPADPDPAPASGAGGARACRRCASSETARSPTPRRGAGRA